MNDCGWPGVICSVWLIDHVVVVGESDGGVHLFAFDHAPQVSSACPTTKLIATSMGKSPHPFIVPVAASVNSLEPLPGSQVVLPIVAANTETGHVVLEPLRPHPTPSANAKVNAG
jgi:hypothetical protein